jgi:hypothetical protein
MASTSPKQAALMKLNADPGLPVEKRRIKLENAQKMHAEDRSAGRFYTNDGQPTPEMREHMKTQGDS